MLSLKKLDWSIIIAVFFLLALSLATLYSLNLNQEIPNFLKFEKQIIAIAIGVAAILFFIKIDYRFLKDWAYLIYGLGLLSLILVLIWGTANRGVAGWFKIGILNFQPVEIFKIILIIALAKFFSGRLSADSPLKKIIGSLLITALPAAIIIFQPDLGSAIILIIIWFAYLFFINLKKKHILIMFLFILLTASGSYFYILKDYQKQRVLSFIYPKQDTQGAAYQVNQSIIAVGSGRLFGRGLGLGTQSSLKFLPEQETDFIFAVIAEEFGFIGASLIILSLGFILLRTIKIMVAVREPFAALTALGLAIYFLSHTLINIGMNIGFAPIVGVPLPFLSYGGSAILSNLVGIGILESIAAHEV